jgi:iron complex transport system substrate-binding protein
VNRRGSLRACCALFALLASFATPACHSKRPEPDAEGRRIVSLAPAITETLFAIGAGSQVVGVSNYCEAPPEARTRPRLGTSITPSYEAIARLRPSLVVSEKNVATRSRELEALAPTLFLPWLTLPEVASGIVELGRLTDHGPKARELSEALVRKLDVPEPAEGPRVLLVLGEAAGDEIWFIRRNSLHGSVLRAAGARNAVAEDVLGPPNLSAERLLALDPEAIVVLLRPDPERPALRAPQKFERFPTLSAVRAGRVGSIQHAAAFSHGPSILELVDTLHAELIRLGALK